MTEFPPNPEPWNGNVWADDVLGGKHSAAMKRRFAVAVAPVGLTYQSDVIILDEQGGWNGLVPLQDATEKHLSFMVPIGPHLTVLDVDVDEHPEVWSDLIEMANDGYNPAVVCRSGSGNNGRAYYQVPEGVDPAAWPPLEKYGLSPDLRRCQVEPNVGKGIRPPLSPHRLGLPAALVHPSDPERAIKSLSKPAWVSPSSPPAYLYAQSYAGMTVRVAVSRSKDDPA